jgi:cytochrome c oxidase subunit III
MAVATPPVEQVNMEYQSILDVRDWERCEAGRAHPFWWGILGLIVVEATVVLTMLASFFYLWTMALDTTSGVHPWSPPDGQVPPLLYPSLDVGLLLVCAASMWYSGVAIRKELPGLNASFAVCCLCAPAVLWLRWEQFKLFSFSWKDSAYASMVWLFTGFHFLHVTSALIGTAVIAIAAYRGFYNKHRSIGVDVDTNYWYFVSFAWIPMYIAIYWLPQL